MGLFTSARARRDGRVTIVQLVGGLLAFVAFSIIGGFLVAGIALPAVTVAGSAAEGTAELFEELPEELQTTRLPQQSNIYARDGETLIATFYHQNRVVVPLEDISPWIQKAVVSIEDRRFWKHNGVDGEGLLRAAYKNATSDDTEGASTLTQQLIKNTLLQKAVNDEDFEAQQAATEVSLARKIREWRLALAYEENLNNELGVVCTDDPAVDCGKEQVLESYLNIAQFGINLYGVEAASRLYFNKPAKEITALEAATIAGITQNPSKWDPLRYPEQAQTRRDLVLNAMRDTGALDEYSDAEYRAMLNTPLEETLDINRPKFSCAASDLAPFFCDYVTKVIDKDEVFNRDGAEMSGEDLLYRGGLEIVTTLDVWNQKVANAELRESLPENDPSGFAMALVSLDSKTGEILAMAQNRRFDPASDGVGETAINYAVDRDMGGSRGFSPGSTFKPIILAEWLNSGRSLSQTVSANIREWEPDVWRARCAGGTVSTGRPWRPTNSGGGGGTQMDVLNATANSVNTAFVAMTNQLDLCDVRDMAERLGYQRADGAPIETVPSMSLGSQNASPLTMSSVMQTFANRGVHCDPIAILSVTDLDGQEYDVPQADCRRVIDESIADGVAYAMTKVIEYGSGSRLKLANGRPAAGKTGTAQESVHTWFAGYTRELTTVVWLGHPDRDIPQQRITLNGQFYNNVYGATISGPTWKRYMDRALQWTEPSRLPTSEPALLNSIQLRVPDLIGMDDDKEIRYAINDAGFRYWKTSRVMFSDEYPPGTVIAQSPAPGSTLGPGATVSYTVATDKLPNWWTNWPSSWDPMTPPNSWWGNQWPPPEWEDNPPNGWDPNPDDDDDEDEGGPGGGGPGGGGGGGA